MLLIVLTDNFSAFEKGAKENSSRSWFTLDQTFGLPRPPSPVKMLPPPPPMDVRDLATKVKYFTAAVYREGEGVLG